MARARAVLIVLAVLAGCPGSNPDDAAPVPGGGGARTRVRAGPFSTEDAADKARQKLVQSGFAKGELKIVKQGE